MLYKLKFKIKQLMKNQQLKSKSKAPVKEQDGISKVINASAKVVRKMMAPLIFFAVVILGKKIKGRLGFSSNIADGNLILRALAVFEAITADTGGYYAADPFAQLAQLGTLIGQFEVDCVNVKNGVLGAEGAKQFTKSQLMVVLDLGVAYINNLAYFDQDHAVEIITGAGMEVVNRGRFAKPDFYAKQGVVTGVVVLRARAPKNDAGKYMQATYFWEYSADNGTTWITLPSTLIAKLVVTGMPINILLHFRKRLLTANGLDAWCTPVGITLV